MNITLAPDVRTALDRYCEQECTKPSHLIEDLLRTMLRETGWMGFAKPKHLEANQYAETEMLRAAETPIAYGAAPAKKPISRKHSAANRKTA